MSKNMPRRDKGQTAVQRQIEMQQMQHYEGPLPHPKHFAQFNAILPGAADRILKMAEDQSWIGSALGLGTDWMIAEVFLEQPYRINIRHPDLEGNFRDISENDLAHATVPPALCRW